MPKHSLDKINIASPCSNDWDEMIGNNQVRFCQECSLHVHNLAQITRKDAVSLVNESKGKLCIRYYRRPDGTTQTADHARPLSQIKRRLSRIAAGAFSATLTLAATAAAQSRQPTERDPQVVINPANARARAQKPVDVDGQTASLTGTVTDLQEAVIAGAKVTLVNTETEREESVESNDEGVYQFQTLEAGIYRLKIESPGFSTYELPAVEIKNGVERRLDATLDVGATMGVVVVMPSTPLIRAIWNEEDENLTEVRSLLAAGVDVNALDENVDSTALFAAVESGKIELVQLLLYAGADPNMRNSGGQTSLMRLNSDSTPEIVWALIKSGAKVNLKDKDGESALMIVAARGEKTSVLQALLDAGARVNAKNKEGKTALMIAAEEGYVENVKTLLLAGANVHKKDNEGRTALRYAQNEGEGSVVAVLASYGAKED